MVFVKTVTQNILPLVRDQYRGGPSANRVGFVVGSLSPKSERSALFRVDALRTNEVAPVARKPPCSNVAMREAVGNTDDGDGPRGELAALKIFPLPTRTPPLSLTRLFRDSAPRT